MRPVLKFFGGKGRIKSFVLENFPEGYESLNYFEPMVGGGGLFYGKKQSVQETICDIDFDVFSSHAFMKLGKFKDIRKIGYNEENFKLALEGKFGPAISPIVKFRFSRGGIGKDFAWSDRKRGGKPGDVNAWETFLNSLETYENRLKNVTILNLSYKQILNNYINSFFYFDPPYKPSTRVTKKVYQYDWTEQDHVEFLDLVKNMTSKVIISGYDSTLYNVELKGWNKASKMVTNNSGQTSKKSVRIETVWFNY